MHWLSVYIAIFICSLVLTLILTPIFKRVAIKIGMVDLPKKENHKSHNKIIPLLGGLAMYLSWMLTILAGAVYPLVFSLKPSFILEYTDGLFITITRISVILIGATLITILGFFDDKTAMSAKFKLLCQFFIVAFVVTFADVRLTMFIDSQIISWVLTVFWILLIINSINFFDNMDGLASGIAVISFFFFAVIAIVFHHFFIVALATAGFGTSLGFWFFNKSPAKIFMGDCGSHFLGYTIAITSALTTYYHHGITQTQLAAFIPIFILGIPLFDLLSVVVIRLKIRKPIYIGDNNHISHRFCKMGMSRKTAVMSVHLLAIILSLGVLPVLWGDMHTAMICLVQGCILLLLISILQYSSKKN